MNNGIPSFTRRESCAAVPFYIILWPSNPPVGLCNRTWKRERQTFTRNRSEGIGRLCVSSLYTSRGRLGEQTLQVTRLREFLFSLLSCHPLSLSLTLRPFMGRREFSIPSELELVRAYRIKAGTVCPKGL